MCTKAIVCAQFAAVSAVDNWYGSMDFKPYATGVSFNMTVSGSTATANWVYDRNGAGVVCAPDTETGLKVVTDGTSITFKGLGTDPSYYSFAGKVNTDGTIGGNVQFGTSNVGTFDLSKTVPAHPKQCVRPPTPPPPPPTPPTPVPPANTPWPYPNDPKFNPWAGSSTVILDSTFSISAASSCPTLDQAMARYLALTTGGHVAAPSVAAALNGTGGGGLLGSLAISVADLDESHMQLSTDPKYVPGVQWSHALHGVHRARSTQCQACAPFACCSTHSPLRYRHSPAALPPGTRPIR
jgi:hypothetical protein